MGVIVNKLNYVKAYQLANHIKKLKEKKASLHQHRVLSVDEMERMWADGFTF